MLDAIYKTFPHNPPHLFLAGAHYMITAGTYCRQPHVHSADRKRQWLSALLFTLRKEQWKLIAFVVLSNHYHVIVQSPESGAGRLSSMIANLHRFTSRQWNDADQTPGRSVWWNYWDTCLTSEASFYARVNYVHWNPVKHGLATHPEEYEFSSYGEWHLRWLGEAQRIEREYPFDRVHVDDDY